MRYMVEKEWNSFKEKEKIKWEIHLPTKVSEFLSLAKIKWLYERHKEIYYYIHHPSGNFTVGTLCGNGYVRDIEKSENVKLFSEKEMKMLVKVLNSFVKRTAN